jgi:hypothetical protein
MKNPWFLRIFSCLGVCLLSSCAIQPKEPLVADQIPNGTAPTEIVKFSNLAVTAQLIEENSSIIASEALQARPLEEESLAEVGFSGWYPWTLLPTKKKTRYRLKPYQGKIVLHADAKESASGMVFRLKPKKPHYTNLSWSWKALGTIDSADNSLSHSDDAPLRLVLGFDGDKSKLSLKEQIAFEMAYLISGQQLPYATLMYIWGGNHRIDEVLTSKYTSRVKMIVVDSGNEHLGHWRHHQRNITEDFKKAFEENPGGLIALGLMTDTDNTKSEVQAIYGDIEFKSNKR